MNNKKKAFIAVWVVVTAALFYFFQAKNDQAEVTEDAMIKEEQPVVAKVPPSQSANPEDELPAELKDRIDAVLEKIEGMWDPTGNKVQEVGEKMEALEKALEENEPELAEKILSEIETIVSEK